MWKYTLIIFRIKVTTVSFFVVFFTKASLWFTFNRTSVSWLYYTSIKIVLQYISFFVLIVFVFYLIYFVMKANCYTSYCAWYSITFLLLWIGFGILLSLQESINMSGILYLRNKFHLIINDWLFQSVFEFIRY